MAPQTASVDEAMRTLVAYIGMSDGVAVRGCWMWRFSVLIGR